MKIFVLDDDQNRIDIFKKNIEGRLGVMDATYTMNATDALKTLYDIRDFDYIFLDHDLGGEQMTWQEENCGMRVVDYIINSNYRKNVSIIVHSWNIPRATEMKKRLEDAGYPVICYPGVWQVIGH